MPTAYMEVLVAPREGAVTLFETEPVLEVEYQIEDGELDGWHVAKLKFQEFRSEWDDTDRAWRRKLVAETPCPDDLVEPLLDRLHMGDLEEQLRELLISTGEIGYATRAAERADYHARLL